MVSQIITALLGVWLMVAPSVLDFTGPARLSALIAGPLAASIGVIAIFEVTRPLRWLNLIIGAWLLVSPLLVSQPAVSAINSEVTGLLLGAAALRRGSVRGQYGGGWSALVRRRSSRPGALV
jgi:hypothetical protein